MPRRKAPPISPPRAPRALSNNQNAAGRAGPAFHWERGACLRRGRAKEGASERRAHRLPVFRRTNVSRETFFAAIRCDEESAWRELGDRAASVRWGWWDEALCGSAGYDGAGAEGARRQRRVRWGWHVGALGEHSVCDGAVTTGCIAWTWRYAGVLRRGAKTRPRAMRSAAMTCVRLGGGMEGAVRDWDWLTRARHRRTNVSRETFGSATRRAANRRSVTRHAANNQSAPRFCGEASTT